MPSPTLAPHARSASETDSAGQRPAFRIAPADAPYDPNIEELFARVMPPGRAPLLLFRTMARSLRVLQKMFAASLLDKGPLALREREILILRTCARCKSEYEWGVHVAFFAKHAGLDDDRVQATLAQGHGGWEHREGLLVQLADALHDKADVPDTLWDALAEAFTDEALLEAVTLVGYYHTISFLTNALRLPNEPDAARFAPA